MQKTNKVNLHSSRNKSVKFHVAINMHSVDDLFILGIPFSQFDMICLVQIDNTSTF